MRKAMTHKDKAVYDFIGESIADRRYELGWTARELGERCGMVHSAILQIERGTKRPRMHTIFAIARALGCTPNDLLPDVNPTERFRFSNDHEEYIPVWDRRWKEEDDE